MRFSYSLCFIGMLFSGCSSTYELKSTDEANTRIHEGKEIVQLQLKSGQEYFGRDLQIDNDSVRFVLNNTKDSLCYSKRDIKFIKVTDQSVGSREGFLVGGICVAATLYIVLSKADTETGMVNIGLRNTSTVIGALIGGVIGAAFGGSGGHHYTYIFPEDSIKVGMRISIDSTNSSSQQIQKSAP